MARYLRVNTLIAPHKDRLDRGAIALRTAVSLSYLSADEQELVHDVLVTHRCRLSMSEADALRSEKKPLGREAVLRIVEDRKRTERISGAFPLKREILSRYFGPEEKPEEIEAIIIDALDNYFR